MSKKKRKTQNTSKKKNYMNREKKQQNTSNKKTQQNKDIKQQNKDKRKIQVDEKEKKILSMPDDIDFLEPINVEIDESIKPKYSLKNDFRELTKDLRENKGRNSPLVWFSMVFLLLGIFIFIYYYITIDAGVLVNAIVSDVVETRTGDDLVQYSAKICYQYDNKAYKDIVYEDASPELSIGDMIKIKIDPTNPKKIYDNKIYIIISIVLLITAVILLFAHFYMGWRKIYLSDVPRTDS